jgi:phosphohistidine phosphatase
MRRLLLLRHGKAAQQSAGGDRERPLTRRGLADARHVGEFLVAQGMTPELAVASNARRARQTMERVLEAFPVHVTHLIENTIYSATVDHLLDILRQSPAKVATMLVVGHNPGFCDLAEALAGAGDPDEIQRMRIKVPPASLAILDFQSGGWADVARGAARLRRFVTPAELRDEADEAD